MGRNAAADLVHRRKDAETLMVRLQNHVKAGRPMASKKARWASSQRFTENRMKTAS